jgi:hypothetical protein
MTSSIWTSQDGNTTLILSKVDGFTLWPAGSSGSSSYPRRLSVYVNGVDVLIREDADIESLLAMLKTRVAKGAMG